MVTEAPKKPSEYAQRAFAGLTRRKLVQAAVGTYHFDKTWDVEYLNRFWVHDTVSVVGLNVEMPKHDDGDVDLLEWASMYRSLAEERP